MRILIDLTQIPVNKVGVGVYAENLIRQLLSRDDDNFYILLVQDDDESLNELAASHKARIVTVASGLFRLLPLRLAMEQLYIPFLVLKFRADLVHSLHYSFPLFAWAKKVVTIHDMTCFLFPDLHPTFKSLYVRTFVRLAARFADHLIFVSKASLDDFLRLLGPPSTKASVVYLGISDDFKEQNHRGVLDTFKIKHGIGEKYFLFVGTIEPRKNLTRLILAFEKLIATGFKGKLVIAGKRGWHCNELDLLLDKAKLGTKVVFTGFITDVEKVALLSGALVFVYPSLYEGFGIPVLEALALGTPTITSNVSSMVEVAGDAALLIDPTNVDQIYESMRLLANDDTLRAELRQKSIQQSRKFSWSETARQTRDIYSRFGV